VFSSLGKIAVKAPVSMLILAMVARSVAFRVLTPSPLNSRIFPRPPDTVSRRRISRATSFAEDNGEVAFQPDIHHQGIIR